MKRTVLALLLAVFMAATLLTVGAAAEGNEAAIGDTKYATLTEALSNAHSGQTVTLLKDIDNSITAGGYTGGINYSLNEGVTLDGADHTISGHIGVRINAAGGTVKNVKFEDIHNNVVVDPDTCEYYGWESKTGNQSAIYASDLTGEAVITGCTFDNIDWDAIQITPTKTAKIEITDNVFKHTNTTDTQLRYVHIQYTAGSFGVAISELTITDNQFYTTENTDDFFCSIGIWKVNKNTPILRLNGNYVEDYSTTEVSVIGLGYLFPARSTPDTVTYDYQPVAYNGTEIYMTLQEAAEKSDSYINMMADAADQTATIPAGKTIKFYSYGYDIGTLTNNGELYIYGSDLAKSSSKIINNGALSLSGNSATVYEVENNGALYVTRGATYDLGKISGSGSVTITGGTFSTKPTADWIATWYKVAEQSDGTFKVSKMNLSEAVEAGMVAASGTNDSSLTYYYHSITEGMNNTEKQNTVLFTDSSEKVVISTPMEKYEGIRVLNVNGFTFIGSITVNDNCGSVRLYGNGVDKEFILTDVRGELLYVGGKKTTANAVIQDAELDMLEVNARGNCVIEGGNYGKLAVQNYYPSSSATEPQYTANLLIEGGCFGSNEVTLYNDGHTPAIETLPIKDFLAPGLVYELNNNGVYSYYKSVEAALAEAEPGAVISYIGDDAPTTYYKVTIVYGNGMSEEVKDIAKDSVLVLPAAPSKNGYIFMGWKCSDGHTHEAGETVVVNSNLTFTAVWSALPDVAPGEPSGPDKPVEPSALPFVDVSVNAWYYESVKAAYEAGLMNGVTDTEFAPNAPLTRAMIWTILARASGVETDGGATWYAKAQEWAVTNGVSDGEDPLGNVTREQLVTMLWRLNGSEVMTGYIGNYIDTGDISEWANQAMLWAVQNGIIEGDENMALAPKADTTRAQAATFFVRYLTVA